MTDRPILKRDVEAAAISLTPYSPEDVGPDPVAWLGQQAQDGMALLAHADDGAIWGKVMNETIVFPQIAGFSQAALRSETLQMARLFDETAEIFLWRIGEGTWRARKLADLQPQEKEGETAYRLRFDEQQVLWGTGIVGFDGEFSLAEDGEEGFHHAPPVKQPEGPRRQPELAGVYLSHSAVALVALRRPVDAGGLGGVGEADAFRCVASPIQGSGDISATFDTTSKTTISTTLQAQKATLGLEKTDCTLVLAPDFYTLSLIERPPVSEQELKDALRWKIQEYLDFPAEEAVLDVFPLPQAASRDHTSMVFVVAVQKSKLKTLVDNVIDAGLRPTSIDITELSLRTLAESLFPEADSAVGLLRITANNGMINISRGDELFLSRRITGVPSAFDEASWDTFKDMMLLQVQRSIDYYESALSQGAAQVLLVAATHEWQSRIVDYLADMLPLGVRDLPEYLCDQFDLELFNPQAHQLRGNCLSSEDKQALAAAIPALGGALRSAQSAIAATPEPPGAGHPGLSGTSQTARVAG